jgi:hypothetical protein
MVARATLKHWLRTPKGVVSNGDGDLCNAAMVGNMATFSNISPFFKSFFLSHDGYQQCNKK